MSFDVDTKGDYVVTVRSLPGDIEKYAAMMTDDDPDIGDFCFITFMLRGRTRLRRASSARYATPAVQDAWERAYSDYRRGRASGPPNRNGWEPRAAGFDVGGGGIAMMPFMVESQGGIHGGIR